MRYDDDHNKRYIRQLITSVLYSNQTNTIHIYSVLGARGVQTPVYPYYITPNQPAKTKSIDIEILT